MGNRRLQAGFTLVEVMVVVVIAGIALAAATPSMRSFYENHRLRSATAELESNLRRARSTAITKDCDARMIVFPERHRFVVLRDADGNGDFETFVSAGDTDAGVALSRGSFNGNDFVTFDSRGVPDNSGSVRLRTHGGKRLDILVAAGSGSISVLTPTDGDGQQQTY